MSYGPSPAFASLALPTAQLPPPPSAHILHLDYRHFSSESILTDTHDRNAQNDTANSDPPRPSHRWVLLLQPWLVNLLLQPGTLERLARHLLARWVCRLTAVFALVGDLGHSLQSPFRSRHGRRPTGRCRRRLFCWCKRRPVVACSSGGSSSSDLFCIVRAAGRGRARGLVAEWAIGIVLVLVRRGR